MRTAGARASAAIGTALLLASTILVATTGARADPVADALAQMTTAQKVGQLVMISVRGTSLSAPTARAIAGLHIGGVILFRANYTSRAQLRTFDFALDRAARAASGIYAGMLIAADQEGGRVKRFPDMPPSSPASIASDGRSSRAAAEGAATARALRSVGVNVDLAPVADLDIGPSHIMRGRSFGSNPATVARLVASFVAGMQRERAAATVKHFPGLGGATVNSDDGRAYVMRSLSTLRAADWQPFVRARRAGVRLVMVSHGIYPTAGVHRPASTSSRVLHWLRDDVGFTGVAISDSVNAIAWRFGGNAALACPATIEAGVDVALETGSLALARACVREITDAVSSGAISAGRLNQAVTRVLLLKRWLGIWTPIEPVPSPSATLADAPAAALPGRSEPRYA